MNSRVKIERTSIVDEIVENMNFLSFLHTTAYLLLKMLEYMRAITTFKPYVVDIGVV